jgi:hypothetical protein
MTVLFVQLVVADNPSGLRLHLVKQVNMKILLATLTIWSLPFFGVSCGSANVQSTRPADTKPAPSNKTLTLTTEHPIASFPLSSDLQNHPPETLEISVTKVVNPAASAVNIFVYLSRAAEKTETDSVKIPVGNFSLYPADRPARFMLDSAPGFRKLAETKSEEWRLVFELKPDENRPSTPVEITIAEPK